MNGLVHPNRFRRWLTPATLLLLVMALALASGCAAFPKKQKSPPALDSGTRSHLGNIALVWEDERGRFEYDEPTSKEEQAGKILSAGATGPAVAGSLFWGGVESSRTVEEVAFLAAIASAAGIVIAAPAALHSAVEGVRSEAEPRLRPARTAMERAAREVLFGEELRRRLENSISNQTAFRVTPESVPELDRTRERPTLQNTYRSLGTQGYDTVIKIRPQAALEGEKRFTLQANVWVSVVEIAPGRELFSQRFSFRSEQRKFSDWAKNDAQRFRTALERCYGQLTEEITRQLFLDSPRALR
jgi:hypothetical protein